ncbi:hypothetical protein PVAND_005995 [Polypedilum vanderplanki]|uniref:alpha-glucosidase n=1 Tax=Polypedilum vanderplanki TaxID=319348 RepID=A0A9J6C1S0_POLVA|nr:hypothetical protein PVAND_005995 [Polypedilum vanderplanki]
MKWLVLINLLIAVITVKAGWLPFWVDEEVEVELSNEFDWWENGVFYQIYPRSFKDDNNDGTGDIKGIISKLEHLKDLGVTGTWLSPIFKSPMVDGGYDISDYTDVNEIYGTKEDLKALFDKAKELGLKIILDFVPNHSSDQHEWFQKSVNNVSEYANYYTWRECELVNATTGERRLVNNWIAVFNTPMWTYNAQRNMCYHHQFTPEQPDMNYRHPDKVIQKEMFNILDYWMDQGADGFRVDAINHLFESASFTNQPLLSPDLDPTLYSSYNPLYTRDLPESYQFIYDVREHMDEYSRNHGNVTRILMTEAYASVKQQTSWYGSYARPGSHVPFNFVFIADITAESNATHYKGLVDEWMENTPSFAMGQANWVLGNHDRPRLRSRFGEERFESMAVMYMMLPGLAIVYYGEEIGMIDNYNITWEQTDDPQACQSNSSVYMQFSRDPVRTPMQWDDSQFTGFCENCEPWLPIHANYSQINVKNQINDEKSTLSLYKNLIALRKEKEVLKKGGITTQTLAGDEVFAFKRTMNNEPTIAVFLNLASTEKTVSLRDLLHADDITSKTKATVLIANNKASLSKGDFFSDINSITLGGYDAVVFEISSATRIAKGAAFTITIFWIIVKIFV